MTATAMIVTAEHDNVLMIPNRALARTTGAGGAQGQTGAGGAQGQAGSGGAQAQPGGNAARGNPQAGGGQGAGQGSGSSAGRPAQVRVETPNGIETRSIRVGLANDQNTEVISGLDEGDEVVLPTTTARATVPGAGTGGGGGGVFGGPGPGRGL
jgi:HlyD family secretion protein